MHIKPITSLTLPCKCVPYINCRACSSFLTKCSQSVSRNASNPGRLTGTFVLPVYTFTEALNPKCRLQCMHNPKTLDLTVQLSIQSRCYQKSFDTNPAFRHSLCKRAKFNMDAKWIQMSDILTLNIWGMVFLLYENHIQFQIAYCLLSKQESKNIHLESYKKIVISEKRLRNKRKCLSPFKNYKVW